MFAIDLSSKRAKLALRFFTYGVMTITTIVISVIVIFFALGYRFDRNFTFSQGGLVQFRSFPDSAEIMVDGVKQDFKTPNKLNMTAGQHTVSMNLKGYLPWSKTVHVEPGQLLWLNYTRFIPESIATSNIHDFDSLVDMNPSPDRHWSLLQLKSDQPEFVLVDMGNEKGPKYNSFSVPDSHLTKKDGKFGTFKIIEWDLGSRYILVRHELGSDVEYIRIDRTKLTEVVNITQEFRLPTREAHFSGNNPNVIFANTDGVLRRLDLGNSSASGALVNNIRQFTVYGSNTIAFDNDDDSTASRQQTVGILKDDKITIVRTLPVSQQVVLAYAEYDNHGYLAVGHADNPKIEVIRDPNANGTKNANTIFAQFDLQAPVRWLSFSNNGRMVTAQNGNVIATYDLEEAKAYQKTFDFGTDVATQMKWLDDFYLWTDTGGRLRIVEFDGENDHEITSLAPGYGVLLSSNEKRLFSVGKDETGKVHLQVSRLTIED